MSIAANRHKAIRAALCYNSELAIMARKHNNANILVLGSGYLSPMDAIKIITIFCNTAFDGGRHLRRINKL